MGSGRELDANQGSYRSGRDRIGPRALGLARQPLTSFLPGSHRSTLQKAHQFTLEIDNRQRADAVCLHQVASLTQRRCGGRRAAARLAALHQRVRFTRQLSRGTDFKSCSDMIPKEVAIQSNWKGSLAMKRQNVIDGND